ncbi:hypothetical protein NMT12_50199 [metagenome]
MIYLTMSQVRKQDDRVFFDVRIQPQIKLDNRMKIHCKISKFLKNTVK